MDRNRFFSSFVCVTMILFSGILLIDTAAFAAVTNLLEEHLGLEKIYDIDDGDKVRLWFPKEFNDNGAHKVVAADYLFYKTLYDESRRIEAYENVIREICTRPLANRTNYSGIVEGVLTGYEVPSEIVKLISVSIEGMSMLPTDQGPMSLAESTDFHTHLRSFFAKIQNNAEFTRKHPAFHGISIALDSINLGIILTDVTYVAMINQALATEEAMERLELLKTLNVFAEDADDWTTALDNAESELKKCRTEGYWHSFIDAIEDKSLELAMGTASLILTIKGISAWWAVGIYILEKEIELIQSVSDQRHFLQEACIASSIYMRIRQLSGGLRLLELQQYSQVAFFHLIEEACDTRLYHYLDVLLPGHKYADLRVKYGGLKNDALLLELDSELPVVLITLPSDGAVVSGTVPVLAQVTDDVGIDSVIFKVGDQYVGRMINSVGNTYELEWNTIPIGQGDKTIEVSAIDEVGKKGGSIRSVSIFQGTTRLHSASITPASGIGDTDTDFSFYINYVGPSSPAPDFVQLMIDGVDYPMASSDTAYIDGVVFSTPTGYNFSEGQHSYHFEALQDGNPLRYPATGSLSFTVHGPDDWTIALSADPLILPVDGVARSLITAVVLDYKGDAVSDEIVTFSTNSFPGVLTDYLTGQSTNTSTTDSGGIARIYFRPRSVGIAYVSGRLATGASDGVNIQAEWSPGNTIAVKLDFLRSDTSKVEYWLTVELLDANSQPITVELVTVTSSLGELQDPDTLDWASTADGVTNADGLAKFVLRSFVSGSALVNIQAISLSKTMSFYLQVGDGIILTTPAIQLPGITRGVDWHDNLLVATGSGAIRLWDTDTWTERDTYEVPSLLEPDAVRFSHSGDRIATADLDVYMLTVVSGSIERQRDPDGFRDIAWTADDSHYIVPDGYGTGSRVFLSNSGAYTGQITGPYANYVLSVDYSNDGTKLAEGTRGDSGGDSTAYLIICNASNLGNKITIPVATASTENKAWAVRWSPDSQRVAVGNNQEEVITYTRTGTDPIYMGSIDDDACAVAWSPDGLYLAGYIASGKVMIWNPNTGQLLYTLVANYAGDRACSLVWSSDSQMIAFASGGGGVKIYAPFDDIPPSIIITSPEDNTEHMGNSVTVTGQASDNIKIGDVKYDVNASGWTSVNLEPDGTFSQDVPIEEGNNEIRFEVTDVTSHVTQTSINVIVPVDADPPMISEAAISPESGELGTVFTISARVVDIYGESSNLDPSSTQALVQDPDETTLEVVQMYDDGTHGDDFSGDSIFTCQWHSSPYPESLYFVDLVALDNRANSAERENILYIDAFDYPVISEVSHNPVQPSSNDSVLVACDVTDSSTIASVELFFSTDSGISWNSISMENSGGNSWDSPIPPQGCDAVQYRIQATDVLGHSAESSTFFYQVQNSISIIAPNGGETWKVDNTYAIMWTSTKIAGRVKIELSRDNGLIWEVLYPDVADDGFELWDVTTASSSNCIMRIGDTDGDPLDVSDATFSISINRAPVTTAVSPVNGEYRDTIPLSAISSDPDEGDIVVKEKYQYSLDGVTGWTDIGEDVTPEDSYYWDSGLNAGTIWIRAMSFDGKLWSDWFIGSGSFLIDNQPPTYENWTKTPSDLTSSHTGILAVAVDVLDMASDLGGNTPYFDYRFGVDAYDGFEAMSLISGDTWSFNVPEPPGGWTVYAGGSLYFKVIAADALENIGESNEQSEYIDSSGNIPPIVTAVSPTNGKHSDPVSLSATSSDPDPGDAVVAEKYEYSLDGSNWEPIPGEDDTPDDPYLWDSGLNESEVWIRASAYDGELWGNWFTGSGSFLIDNLPPTYEDWTNDPANVISSYSGVLDVTVDILDPVSGLGGNIPQLDYRFESGLYNGFEPMSLLSGNTWSFTIPEPAGGWDSHADEILYYKVNATDEVGNSSESNEQAVGVISIPAEWTRYPHNPVLPLGTSGSWDDYRIYSPAILHDGTEYKMWYSAYRRGGNAKIGLATSADGIVWEKYTGNPVLPLGSSGSWDDYHVANSCVLYDGTTYRMWYGGYDGTKYRIGYATSTDGIDWVKSSKNPVLSVGAPGSWEYDDVNPPSVIFDGTQYRMWYTGQDVSNGTLRIGLAISTDGIEWEKHSDNPVLNLGPVGSWDDSSVSAPCVLYDGRFYRMWYTGTGALGGKIGCAVSLDGVVWTKHPDNPILDVGAIGEWDEKYVGGPSVIFEDPVYNMCFEGYSSSSQIGYATTSETPDWVFDDVSLAAGWNMISWPGEPTSSSVADIVAENPDVLPYFYTWDPGTGGYVMVNEVRFGDGYWVAATQDCLLRICYIPVYELTRGLAGGWNMAGSLACATPVSSLTSSPPYHLPYVYTWDCSIGGYKIVDDMLSTVGHWVAATDNCNLTMSCSASPLAESQPSVDVIAPTWKSTVSVEDQELAFGMHPSATDGFDRLLDRPLPPPPAASSDYVEKRGNDKLGTTIRAAWLIQHDAFPMLGESYIKEASQGKWELSLELPRPGKVGWSDLPEGYRCMLHYDKRSIDMNAKKFLSLPAGNYNLTLVLDALDSLPEKTQLLANYPNPFNPETWIPYELEEDNDVKIRIYTATGQLVRTLSLGHKPAGFYTNKAKAAYWDGKNEAGEQVSSGVYFCTIQAGEFTSTRKMILAR